jgi:hypothetical protein
MNNRKGDFSLKYDSSSEYYKLEKNIIVKKKRAGQNQNKQTVVYKHLMLMHAECIQNGLP